MKKLLPLFVVVLLTLTTSCDTKEPIVSQTTSTLTISYDLTSPLEGTSMTKASSKADIFSEFYIAIKSGELMSPTYDLTFTEVNTGESFRLQGKWNHRESLAVKMGTYNVTGNATAEGEYIQEFCSVVINTSNVVIDQDEATLSLKASYDCALVIFADESIESVVNHTAGTDEGLFVFSNYIYAFVNDSIWDKATLSYLCGTRENGSQFTISTSGQPFEKGKFYIYDTTKTNSLGYLVDIPEMEEGEIHIQPLNEIWYTSTDCEIVTPYNANVFGANIISNTYENGKGVIIFDGYVTSIGDAAFYRCSSLVSITIPENVTSIGWCAFMTCTSLTSITIPEGVTSIEDCAFYDCPSLTSVYCIPTTPPRGGSKMFYGNATDRKIYVPARSEEAYKSAEGWGDYTDAIVKYYNMISIDGDFADWNALNTDEYVVATLPEEDVKYTVLKTLKLTADDKNVYVYIEFDPRGEWVSYNNSYSGIGALDVYIDEDNDLATGRNYEWSNCYGIMLEDGFYGVSTPYNPDAYLYTGGNGLNSWSWESLGIYPVAANFPVEESENLAMFEFCIDRYAFPFELADTIGVGIGLNSPSWSTIGKLPQNSIADNESYEKPSMLYINLPK